MRVVAGSLGGRRLISPSPGASVRPTADRVREALFSILGDVSGAGVLDLFCGTGALAIEAVSRGASRAVLVDSDPGLARQNVDALGLADRCAVEGEDAIRYLERTADRFDLIFCDPPYELADRLGPRLDSLVPQHLAPGGRLILESAGRHPLELSLPLVAERIYGEALIRVHGEVTS